MAITVVQSLDGNNGWSGSAGSDFTKNFASNITAGNAVIVLATWANTNTGNVAGAITDGPGDTFSFVVQVNDSTDGQSLGIWWTSSSAGGSTGVTVHSNTKLGDSSQFDAVVAYEVSGLGSATDGSAIHDSHAGGSSSANGDTSGNFSTGSNGDLVVAGFIDDVGPTASTWTAGTSPVSFTIPANSQDTTSTIVMEYAVQSSSGAINPTITYGSTDGYIACGAAFKASGGAAPSPIRPPMRTLRGVGI